MLRSIFVLSAAFSLFSLISLAASGTARAADDVKSDLEGDWQAVSMEGGGAPAPKEKVAGLKFSFAGDQLTVDDSGKKEKSPIKIDATKTPKEMDVTVSDQFTILAIYKVDGDTLTFCFRMRSAEKKTERPTDFAAPKEVPGQVLAVFKRIKP